MILFAGDTHMNWNQIRYLYRRVAENPEVTAVFQCGDFGYWPRDKNGDAYLEGTSELAQESGIPFYFVDGNHEDHDALDQLERDDRGVATVKPMLYHVGRGGIVELDSRRIMGYGGAFSIDKDWRTPGWDWFPQETISHDHVREIGSRDNGHIDILVSHDAPYGADVGMGRGFAIHKASFPETDQNQLALYDLVDRVQPDRIICGHWHARRTSNVMGKQVDVLSLDGSSGKSWLLA